MPDTETRLMEARAALARASRRGGLSEERRKARIELALAWRAHYLELARAKGDEASALRHGKEEV